MNHKGLYILFIAIGIFTAGGRGFTTPVQENVKLIRHYSFDRSYTYRKESLIISGTDIYFSYFIGDVDEALRITDPVRGDLLRTIFTSGERMFINKGSDDGMERGGRFSIVGKGQMIRHPHDRSRLGYLCVRKAICTVTEVYSDTSVITIGDAGNPVEKGDVLIPFSKQEVRWAQMPDYSMTPLPVTDIQADVIYLGEYIDEKGEGITRDIAGRDHYLSLDIGQEVFQRGDYVLFHRRYKKNLPPLIIGVGVILSSNNRTSTAKILECSSEIIVDAGHPELNTKATPLKIEPEPFTKEEKIPGVTTGKESSEPLVEEQISGEEEVFNAEIYYPIDSPTPAGDLGEVMAKIGEMISKYDEYVIILRGYTCTIGQVEYNLKLSEKRVKALKNKIVKELGVDGELIQTYFYGESESAYDNSLEKSRKKNRRVTVEVRGR